MFISNWCPNFPPLCSSFSKYLLNRRGTDTKKTLETSAELQRQSSRFMELPRIFQNVSSIFPTRDPTPILAKKLLSVKNIATPNAFGYGYSHRDVKMKRICELKKRYKNRKNTLHRGPLCANISNGGNIHSENSV